MKKLEMNQMEMIEGGWRWGGCVSGMALAMYSNTAEIAGILGGPAAAGAVLLGSCIAGGILFD